MFRHVFGFELRYHLRSALFWLAAGLFFLIVFGAITSDFVQVGGAIGNVNRNSPFVIATMLGFVSVAGVFVSTAFVAGAVLRDREFRIHEILFSTRMTKGAYIFGRFAGAYVAAILMAAVVVPAILLGSFMPWLEPERVGPTLWQPYLWGLLVIVLPNLFLMSAVFFGLATLTRSLMYTYVGLVAIFVAYGLAGSFIGELETEGLATLLDPFGQAAVALVTKYWTTVERNTLTPGLAGPIVRNRLIWMGVGVIVLAITYARFSFAVAAGTTRRRAKRVTAATVAAGRDSGAAAAPLAVARSFDRVARRRQFIQLARLELTRMVRSLPFLIILALGVLNVLGGAASLDQQRGTAVHPVTHIMLTAIQSAYLLFAFIILVIYSGETVWRDRGTNTAELLDTLPVPDGLIWGAKLTSIFLLIGLVMLVGVLSGIGFQLYHGYTNLEIPLYFKGAFLEIGIPFLQIAVLAFFLQVITGNRYAGYMLMILWFLSIPILEALDFDHNLYRYANSPGIIYSDMNGYGHFVAPTFWFYLYWTFAACALLALIHLFWLRGRDDDVATRRRRAALRFTPGVRLWLAASLIGFGATGGWIYYNTNVLNEYLPDDVALDRRADYEKRYQPLDSVPQPRITAVRTSVDLYPEERRVDVRGTYTIRNKTAAPVDQLHLLVHRRMEARTLDVPGATVEHHDSLVGWRTYRFASPMQPGDELVLRFDLTRTERGFANGGSNTDIVYNGSFLNNVAYFPHIGYSRDLEIQDPNERRRRDLPPVERMPKLEDEAARVDNYITAESDWIDFEATVSTSADQIAIAPGYLQREWEEDGRRFFTYRMDAPILGFFSFLSARYVVARDRWNDVAIEVWHDPAHPYNVERMIDAVKKSLDYFTTAFGPYQHRQVRIIEFPRYASFAQSFPNTIPYSEGIGFIAKIEKPDDIDWVFYVTAHEVAHQWWAHQVMGANVQGATMTSETMAQYSALMVMEKEYGPALMRRFLAYELDSYLRGRGGERIEELPLLRVEFQSYIHYNKGSLVTYAVRDYLGEDRLNRALAEYVDRVKFQEPPWTTSRELLDAIRAVAPEHDAVLTDLFERIVLFDNRATAATATRTEDGRWAVRLEVEAHKYVASGQGEETETTVDDWIDIGVFAAPGEDGADPGRPLFLEKRRIAQSTTSIEIIVDEPPARAGIDPYNKLIDRNPDNNTVAVTTTGN